MEVLASLTLALLALLLFRLKSTILFPPVIFCSWWSASLLALWLAGDMYYPVSGQTILIYVVGALMFSAGGTIVAILVPSGDTRQSALSLVQRRATHLILDLTQIALLLLLPVYASEVVGGLDMTDPLAMARIRFAFVEATDSSERSFSALKNLPTLAILTALGASALQDDKRSARARTLVAMASAAVYGSITGTKGNVVTLLLAWLTISFVKSGKSDMLRLVIVVASTLGLFVAGLLTINMAYLGMGLSGEAVRSALGITSSYWLGGLVAFDRVVQSPNSVLPVQSIFRFLLETANGLGASYWIPSIHAAHSDIGPGLVTNVYTIYYSYWQEWGWIGLCTGLTLTGAAITAVYLWARRGHAGAVMAFAYLVPAILFSVGAERILVALNFYAKLGLFFLVVFRWAPTIASRVVWRRQRD